MKYYCIGIKGTGMSTLAQILNDLGHEVSGYDDEKDHKFTQIGLEERSIPIYYDQEHDIDKDTIVTYSVAFKEDHEEIQRVKQLGLQVIKYNELMKEFEEFKKEKINDDLLKNKYEENKRIKNENKMKIVNELQSKIQNYRKQRFNQDINNN